MNSKLATIIILLLLTLVISSGASAEFTRNSDIPAPVLAPITTDFTYQGSLTDGGSPANGAYDFEFKLFNDASVGTQVGSTVTKGDVDTSEGIFTVELGFGDVFDGTAYWLEIWVRPGASTGGYQQLLPRQPLTAVPYANYALGAPWSGLSGIPAGFADGVDDGETYSAGNQLDLVGTTFNVVEGPGSGLNADYLDWHDGEYFRNASNINAGNLSTNRFSAYSDLVAEARFGGYIYLMHVMCGAGSDSLTTTANCSSVLCHPAPLYLTCDGVCSRSFPATCPNTNLGRLVD